MSYEYNPNVFATEKPRNIFLDRIDCWADTQKLSKKFEAPPKSIKFSHNPELKMEKKYSRTPIQIDDLDTIECGLLLKKNNYNPLVLNLADPIISCVSNGSGCNEESILRCTNLCRTLIPFGPLYPIGSNEAILSNKIRILKTSEKSGWKLIRSDIFLDFIAACGIQMPKIDYTDEKNPKFKSDTDVEILEKKIELILQVAYLNSNDSIILGALGCGAFKSPPKHTAEIFKEVLKKYDGVFKRIHFAILKNVDDMYILKNHNAPKIDNYDIFREVFENT